MKRLSFFLAFLLVLSLGSGSAFGQCDIQIESVTNTDGMQLKSGKTHLATFRLRSLCSPSGDFVYNTVNGIKVYSPDGALMGDVQGTRLQPWFDLGWGQSFANHFEGDAPTGGTFAPAGGGTAGPSDGNTGNAVAINFAGVTFGFPAGLQGGFDDLVWTIEFTSREADIGKSICIDSTFTPPGGTWGWASTGAPAVKPDWYQAPQCYEIIEVLNDPPEFTNCVANYTFSHCDVGSIDFDALDITPPIDGGPDPYTFSLVSGPGAIDANTGVWTWSGGTVPQSGFDVIEVSVCDAFGCGATCVVNIEVTNVGPSIQCPGGDPVTISTGDTKCQTVVTGDDCDALTLSITDVINGHIDDVINIVGNDICFTPGGDARTVDMEVTVDDGEQTASCRILWNVITTAPYIIRIEKEEGPDGQGALQGHYVNLSVTLESILAEEGLGGFDILIAYDNSVLSFQSAIEGTIYDECGWEYFTYRFGPNGNCGNGCPSGMVRVTGLAETNNGPYHPGCAPSYVNGLPTTLFDLVFLVSNDRTYECQYAPVRFFWYDCGDNTLSNADGTELYISSKVFFFGNDVPINDGEIGFPTFQGAQNICLEGDKGEPIRNIDFFDGGIDIVCADSIDARGDINMNGVAYEIADAVMLTNYFIYGLAAFEYVEGAIAASDVNADGIPLSVADLVYLIRVVVGDALPYPKLNPMVATYTADNGKISVSSDMGAAHLVLRGEVIPTLLAENMEMKVGYSDGNTNVLVYSTTAGNTFAGDFLEVDADVISADMATYEGQPVSSKLVPGSFSLEQNYPNPFNPTTTVSFAIPGGGEYQLIVYNTIGQVVTEVSGYTEGFDKVEFDLSGNASGVYFYKLITANESATKKAVLLK